MSMLRQGRDRNSTASRLRGYIIRFAIAMLGYALAVIVSVLVATFLMILPTVLPDDGAWGSFYRSIQDAPAIVAFGMYLTGMFAFPGFVVTLVLSILLRWRHWLPFTIAGGLDAVLALYLSGGFGGVAATGAPGGLLLSCVPGGLAGGFAYWITAGRFLARKRDGMPA